MPRRCGEPIKTKASESMNFAGNKALKFKTDVRFLMLKKKPCQIHAALKKPHPSQPKSQTPTLPFWADYLTFLGLILKNRGSLLVYICVTMALKYCCRFNQFNLCCLPILFLKPNEY
jgi:hypothetical protein